MKSKLRVAVIMGGPSVEYEVSLNTGKNVLSHIDRDRYSPEPVVISKEEHWDVLIDELPKKYDVAFLAAHGSFGEDGMLQRDLDVVGVPYTGSKAHVSALAMNKFASLRLLRDAGFTVPPTLLLNDVEWQTSPSVVVKQIEWFTQLPYVIKPNRSGSSVGVHIIQESNDLSMALTSVFLTNRDVIVQPYIQGTEVTCGVLDQGLSGTAYPLPPTEIIPNTGTFFDYDAKYKVGGAHEITPARLSDGWIRRIRFTAKAVHEFLGCRGFSRVDMIVGDDGELYVLEINTILGLTKTSLLPKAAKTYGILFPDLIHRIIQASFNTHR